VIAPVQVGDTQVWVIESVAGARIKVFADLEKVGDGSAPVLWLTRPIAYGETVYVLQELGKCIGSTVRVIEPRCVVPHVSFNPAGRNLFPVGTLEYDNGGGIKGSVYYPAEDDGEKQPFNNRLAEVLGPSPIVFMAHGNHGKYYNPADRHDESCYDPGGWPVIPNYQGYRYFQRQLARMGIIAVSVDCNETNCTPPSFVNIQDRNELIQSSIDHFQSLNGGGDEIFGKRIDFDRVGLMGHSRGAQAVVLVGNEAPDTLGVTVRAVISLAPTDARLPETGESVVPQGYAYMTVLPAADGDVVPNPGARFYDMNEPAPLKSQLYIDLANHNFFNREWVNDERNRPSADLLPRSECEHILSRYGCALFRAYLLGHHTTGFLTYRAFPPGIDTDNVHLSFEWANQLTVDDHEDGNGIDFNSLPHPSDPGQPTSHSGMSVDEYTLEQSSPNPYSPNTFWGKTVGMVVKCEEPGGRFRSQLDREYDLTKPGYEIWIRAAEVSGGGANPSGATGFELGLEDVEGSHVWADSDDVGGLPRPFDRPYAYGTKTMFTTLRFPIRCFKPEKEGAEFLTDRVVAILIRCNRDEQRPLAFDVLQIVYE
jgi:dienelactone hydrolase